MINYKRIFIIVADSLGVGALDDACSYNDEGANTLKHLSYAKAEFMIPILGDFGIGHITDVNNTPPTEIPLASYGKMKELSAGKDTLTGHWELMGLRVRLNFPTFTDQGFPPELIAKLSAETGHTFIGNYAASGTEIIKELGEEHIKSKAPIIYTSADSVLQIAANEAVIPLDELYRICATARNITMKNPEWLVGRVIARPFIGMTPDEFQRTPNRHDYALAPPKKTVLDHLYEDNYDVIAIGKISDIFAGKGISKSIKTINNKHGMEELSALAKKCFTGLAFINLVDFDAVYGHRRNAVGYAEAVEEFDHYLGHFITNLNGDDLLIICADHGNDPVHRGTDHTREHVPLLVYNKHLRGVDLGTRSTFADVGATVSANFNVKMPAIGVSFLKEIQSGGI